MKSLHSTPCSLFTQFLSCPLKVYIEKEDGAVAVDWIVMSALVLGSGAAVVSSLHEPFADLVAGAQVSFTSTDLTIVRESGEVVSPTDYACETLQETIGRDVCRGV